MKVYTKTGDKGTTALIGGTRVAKSSMRLEAYGTVDELNSYIGMIRSFPIANTSIDELLNIQNILFNLGGNLATDTDKVKEVKLGVTDKDVEFLEKAIDKMDMELPPLKHFVLPGGNQPLSFCHISRTVCRRAERRILSLSDKVTVDELVIKYINRLSDYLFVLSRKIAHDMNVLEINWIP